MHDSPPPHIYIYFSILSKTEAILTQAWSVHTHTHTPTALTHFPPRFPLRCPPPCARVRLLSAASPPRSPPSPRDLPPTVFVPSLQAVSDLHLQRCDLLQGPLNCSHLHLSHPHYATELKMPFKKQCARASLVAQWLRIHLPMQGTWV